MSEDMDAHADPSAAETEQHFEEAFAHHRAGRRHEAQTLYRIVLSADPAHGPALHGLGVLAHEAGESDAAVSLLELALTAIPTSVDVLSSLGLALVAAGRPAEGMERLLYASLLDPSGARRRRSIDEESGAGPALTVTLERCRERVGREPDHPGAWLDLAAAALALGRADEAIPAYRHALALSPEMICPRVCLGHAQVWQGLHASAIDVFRDALFLAPADPVIHFCLAEALCRAGDLTGSIGALSEALRCQMAGGALGLPWGAPQAPRYPSARYPEALRAAVRCLDIAGITAFLISGTLLGAMREGDFMGHDSDIDFGIQEDVTEEALTRALTADGNFRYSHTNGAEPMLISYYHDDIVAVDFWRVFRRDDRPWHGLYVNGHLLRFLHEPFGLRDFSWHGVTVKVPDDPDRFLTGMYGAWRVPNPWFGLFASPNIEGGFPPISRYLAYTGIFRAVMRRELDRAIDLCEQVIALASGDALIAELLTVLTAPPVFQHGTTIWHGGCYPPV